MNPLIIKTSPSPVKAASPTSSEYPEKDSEKADNERGMPQNVLPFARPLQYYAALTKLSRTAGSQQWAAQEGLRIQEFSASQADYCEGLGHNSDSPWVGLKVFDLPGACSVIKAPSLSSAFRTSSVDLFCAYASRRNGLGIKKVSLRRVINCALSGAAPYRKQVLRGAPIEVEAQLSFLPPPSDYYTFLPQVSRTKRDVPSIYILCSSLGSAALGTTAAGIMTLPHYTGLKFSKFVVLPQAACRIALAGEGLATSDVTTLSGSSLLVVEVPVLHATLDNRDLDPREPIKVVIQGYHASAQPRLSAESAKTAKVIFEGFREVMDGAVGGAAGLGKPHAERPFWAAR